MRQLLQRGDAVTATTRSIERLLDALGDVDTARPLLGSDSYDLARARIEALTADVEAARELALTTDV